MFRSLLSMRRLALPSLAAAAVVALPPQQLASTQAAPLALSDNAILKAATITPVPPSASTTSVHLFGFNDFHGYTDPGAAGTVFNGTSSVPAGGAPQFARVLEVLRAANPNSATVAAGDLVGASPLASALFDDEPSLDIFTAMGVDNSSVGNHEFDKGVAELHRKQDGGCNPADPRACSFVDPGQSPPPPAGQGTPYPGTTMQYLAANVVDSTTNQPIFPPYAVRTIGGQKIGFIGTVLKNTPQIVTPSGVAGLTFLDEAQTANSYVPELLAQGVQTIVLMIHQGGFNGTGGTFTTCSGLNGDIVPIAQALDSHIPIVVSGHTHAAYNCSIPTPQGDKLITSALSNGRVITDIGLAFNLGGALSSATANNVIVDTAANTLAHNGPNGTTGDPLYDRVEAIQKAADAQAAPIAKQLIGSISADITRASTPAGEQAAGDLIADAQLAATQGTAGAQIAFMNPGGVRNDFLKAQISGGEQAGQVTYGEAFSVQPFGNSLVTKTLTGTQIKQLLEQQFVGCFGQTTKRILLPSAGFTYTQDLNRPACNVVDPATIKLNGATIDPSGSYRVTMNSFLATGGDGFTTFNSGTNPIGGAQDIDALVSYFNSRSPIAPLATDRIALVSGPTPVVPEVPFAVLAPLATLALLGGGALVRRRRPALPA